MQAIVGYLARLWMEIGRIRTPVFGDEDVFVKSKSSRFVDMF